MDFSDYLVKFIKKVADEHLHRFSALGFAPAGNNGPYQYKDTNVRNTSHWLIIYAFLWKRFNDESYKNIALEFGEYLIAEQKKSKSGAIECMDGEKFDHLNGLIGQAWVVEALVYGYNAFKEREYLDCATRIYRSQKFNEEIGYWERIELDETNLGYDPTLNHQVWFAIAGLIILKEQEIPWIREQVDIFLDRLERDYFAIYPNGMIKHFGMMGRPQTLPIINRIKIQIKDFCLPMKKINPNKYDSKAQEIGYHIFELYGYAIMKYYVPDFELFDSSKFIKAVSLAEDMDKMNRLYNISGVLCGRLNPLSGMNRFAYGYNSPAFEYPLVKKIFFDDDNDSVEKALFDTQLRLTYDGEAHMFSKNNYDPETLTARLYECVRFCD